MKTVMDLREGHSSAKARLLVHMGTCGIAAGARTVMTALMEETEKRNLDSIVLNITGCAGLCSREPMMTVELAGKTPVMYVDLTPEKAREILNTHVIGGRVLARYALAEGGEKIH